MLAICLMVLILIARPPSRTTALVHVASWPPAGAALAAYPWLSCSQAEMAVPSTWGIKEDVYCAVRDQPIVQTAQLHRLTQLHGITCTAAHCLTLQEHTSIIRVM